MGFIGRYYYLKRNSEVKLRITPPANPQLLPKKGMAGTFLGMN